MVEEKENVVEETNEEQVEQVKQVENTIDESKFESAGNDNIIKVDLSKPPVQEEQATEEVEKVEEPVVSEEEVVEETPPALQEVTDEVEKVEEEIVQAITEAEQTGKPLPENVERLIEFMEETGGDLNDYVQLNRDISKLDDSEVLDEYYRTTKSHLTPEERGFLLEDSFGIDEEVDDDKVIRKKKIALKEQVAEAKAYLDGQKSKYYKDIKAGSKLTEEQQKAINFFDSYNKESEEQNKISEAHKSKFKQRTENVFNDKFKGFDYQVGDKKFRFNVKDANKVKETQSDLNNFVNKFVGEDSTITDAKGYHKSLFTAMNADAVANHFYEQGRADAVKSQVAKDKNINTDPRGTHGEYEVGGVKVRVLGQSSNDMQNRSFKIKSKNRK